ncbi:MAG: hypothetical protein ACKO5Q_21385, partial [Microcystaceae cyanobacterium]
MLGEILSPGEITKTLFYNNGGETRWWLRLFFYHLPVRLLILTGDSPVHDYHHRRPASDWVNAHCDRQAEL